MSHSISRTSSILGTSTSYLEFPRVQREEGVPVRGGEGEHAGVRAAVVRLGDRVELLLPRRVPQHQPHLLAVYPAYIISNQPFNIVLFHDVGRYLS